MTKEIFDTLIYLNKENFGILNLSSDILEAYKIDLF